MKSWFVAADGRVRSGWVVSVFTVLAVTVVGLINLVASRRQVAGVTLDDARVAWLTWPSLLGAVAVTAGVSRLFAEPVGLRGRGRVRQLGVGLAAGSVGVAVAVLGPVWLGGVTMSRPEGSWWDLCVIGALQVVTVGPAGVGEELLLRGLPLQALARGTRPAVAVALTSVTFGALHLMNPSSSWVAAVNVALVGAWFGVLAWRTGSLWTSIGAHVAWNWCEGFALGHPVSGIQPGRALVVAGWPPERGFWSGGAFGPEASGWTTLVLCVAVALSGLIPLRRDAARTAPGG